MKKESTKQKNKTLRLRQESKDERREEKRTRAGE